LRHWVARRQCDNLIALRKKERINADEQRSDPSLNEVGKGSVDILFGAVYIVQLKSKRPRCPMHVTLYLRTMHSRTID
jgi:hypothetical protein